MLRYATVFKPQWRLWVPLTLVSLAAFALRIFRIEHQSLWYDEAFSVYLAKMDLGAITARTAADIQPPLYYYLLHFWMGFVGESEISVRFLSLVFGVLTVPLMYVVARRTLTPGPSPAQAGEGSRTAGMFAALIALVSPLHVWYSQETRMYTLITFLGLVSSYLLLRALEPPGQFEIEDRRKGWLWTLFALTNIAAVYTHYFAFVIIAFQAVYALWVLFARRTQPSSRLTPHASRHALLAFAAVFIAFLPWLPFVTARLGEDASYFRGDLKLDEAVRHIFIVFAAGESVLENIAQFIAAAWLAVLLVGLLMYLIDRRRTTDDGRAEFVNRPSSSVGLIFPALYLIIPLALLLFLFSRNPKFNARYLMIASPGLILLLGVGLASLWRLASRRNIFARVVAGALLLGALGILAATSAYADYNAYFDPAFTKADFRGVAQYITANAHAYDASLHTGSGSNAPSSGRNDASEAIILTSGHMFPAFDYYYTAARDPELRLPDDPTLNAEHVLGYAAADDLNRALAGKHGAWLVQWQDDVVDPNGFVPMLLSTRGSEDKLDAAFWQIKLRHWTLLDDAKPFSAQPEIANPREANFKNQFKLLGWSQPQATSADVGASLRLYWQALDTNASSRLSTSNSPASGQRDGTLQTDDYNVAIRIVDAQGNFWGKVDRRPAGYNYPTTRWKKGENLFGDYTAAMLPGTPAGDYFATVTMFTASDQTGLDVIAPNGAPIGKSVKIGPIHVLPAEKQPEFTDLNIQHTLSARVGPFTLLGYTLSREQASTGESIPITLFWRADEKPNVDYTFQIQFGDKASAALPLGNATFPTSQWRAGEIVRGQYLVQVPPDASAGVANLRLNLLGEGNNTVADLLQTFTIEKTDRVFVAPHAQFAQDANFNNFVALTGYNLSVPEIKPGDTLTVTLDWKALGKIDKDYTVFVHLLDKDSKPVAQKDAQPMNGARKTTTWVEGEYLADAYPLALKPDTPPGEYRLEIGWYDASDPAFTRLQVQDANGNPAGDHVILNKSVIVR